MESLLACCFFFFHAGFLLVGLLDTSVNGIGITLLILLDVCLDCAPRLSWIFVRSAHRYFLIPGFSLENSRLQPQTSELPEGTSRQFRRRCREVYVYQPTMNGLSSDIWWAPLQCSARSCRQVR